MTAVGVPYTTMRDIVASNNLHEHTVYRLVPKG